MSAVLNYKLYNIRLTTTFSELSISCETGMLFYVMKFDQGPLSTLERIHRARTVANACADYANTYMGLKAESDKKKEPSDTKGNMI